MSIQAILSVKSDLQRKQSLIEIAGGLHLVQAGFTPAKLPERKNRREVDYEVDGGAFYVEVTHLSPHSDEGANEAFFDELDRRLEPIARQENVSLLVGPETYEAVNTRGETAADVAQKIGNLVRNRPAGADEVLLKGFGEPISVLVVSISPAIGHPTVNSFRPMGPRHSSDEPVRRLHRKILDKQRQLAARSPSVLLVLAEGTDTDRRELDLATHALEAGTPRPTWPNLPTTAGIVVATLWSKCGGRPTLHAWRANPGFSPALPTEIVDRLRRKR